MTSCPGCVQVSPPYTAISTEYSRNGTDSALSPTLTTHWAALHSPIHYGESASISIEDTDGNPVLKIRQDGKRHIRQTQDRGIWISGFSENQRASTSSRESPVAVAIVSTATPCSFRDLAIRILPSARPSLRPSARPSAFPRRAAVSMMFQ